MSKRKSPSDWKRAFKARVQLLREGAGLSQGEMARQLGVAKDTYAKWENRAGSLLRHDLIPDFLAITGGSFEYLFEGRSGAVAKGDKQNGQDRAA